MKLLLRSGTVGNTSGWEGEAELMLMQPTVLKFFEVDGIAQRAHGLISHGGNNNANTPVDQDSKGSHAWFRPRHQADPPSRPEQWRAARTHTAHDGTWGAWLTNLEAQ